MVRKCSTRGGSSRRAGSVESRGFPHRGARARASAREELDIASLLELPGREGIGGDGVRRGEGGDCRGDLLAQHAASMAASGTIGDGWARLGPRVKAGVERLHVRNEVARIGA